MGQSTWGVDLLGPDLLKQKGEIVKTAEACEGKYVALYFSAHWCPRCRGFTPKLAETYKKIVADGKNWEVVFCSSDQDQSAFDEYFGEMPWLSLPYEKRDLKEQLSEKYGVRGIPSLILLDLEGKVITKNGRSKVAEPEAFPWIPLPFNKCFSKVIKDGNTMEDFDINKGVKALYFSGHWCGPCRGFTPKLIEAYNELRANNPDFEVVFVTSDRSQEQFDEYFGTMPWAALPFDSKTEISSIEEKFEVQGIPSMVVFQDGQLLNKSAVGLVRDQGAAGFPWKQEAVQELTMGTVGNIQDYPCVILFQEGLNEDVQKANAAFLENAASAQLDKELSGNKRDVAFYVHNKEAPQITGIMKHMMTEINDANKMVILHLGGDGAYYVADMPKSEADVTKFVSDFQAGNLTKLQANPPPR